MGWLSGAGCGSDDAGACAPGDPECEQQTCEGGCPDGQVCASGRCVAEGLQCSYAGEECNPAQSTSEGFLCIDWAGRGGREAVCSQVCASDATCPVGSSCFMLRSALDSACTTAADCSTDMMCIQGTCRFTACQPSECEGFASGQQSCQERYGSDPAFDEGAKCYEFGNEANYCLPAGTRLLDESCINVDQALQTEDFEQTCAVGLGCVAGTCRVPCESSSECPTSQTCVVGEATDLGDGVGFCAQPCTPFEDDTCSDEQTCRPVGPDAGHCVSAGDKPSFSRCTPGEGECEPDTLCVEYTTAGNQPEARCQPMCDLSAAPPAEDGTIGEGAQTARDATCPQPPEAPASVRFVHVAQGLGPVDIYERGEETPVIGALDFEAAFPDVSTDGGWHHLEPGRYEFAVLPAGAPHTDRPLVEVSADLSSGVGKELYLGPAQRPQSAVVVAADRPQASSGPLARLVHLVDQAGALDVIALAEGGDLQEPTDHIVLAEQLDFGEGGALVGMPADTLRVLAFKAGSDRTSADEAVLEFVDLEIDDDTTLVLAGSLAAADPTVEQRATLLPLVDDAPTVGDGPRLSCTARADDAFGFCQQICTGGAADFGQDVCAGEAMGCTATEFPRRDEWLTLCAPVGEAGAGAACDPERPHGGCDEGLYCLQYGAGAPEVDGVRGRCTPLCAVDEEADTELSCLPDQSCQALAYDGSFDVGQCGWQCEPGGDYGDGSCPSGLRSCKPIASLHEDVSGQSAPMVRHEQPFCSPSGPAEAGQPCRGLDCEPGTECLFGRSEQVDLVSTLLSPYFASANESAVCRPQCDPFDGDQASHECEADETCLFNYPWSAEVGHCAPIEEDLAPMQSCDKPGLACGEDSICALNQGEALCYRFCDYMGADAQGAFAQSTCPSGLVCGPFVNDIGICQEE
jgi:hypothetical protein